MLTFVIAFLVCFAFFGRNCGDKLFKSLVVSLVIFFVFGIKTVPPEGQYAVRDTTQIVSAVSSSKIKGSFVLGSGTVEGKRYYAYWTKEGTKADGAVRREVIYEGERDVEIVESQQAMIVETVYKRENTWMTIWVSSLPPETTIYVPSVNYEYDIRLE